MISSIHKPKEKKCNYNLYKSCEKLDLCNCINSVGLLPIIYYSYYEKENLKYKVVPNS